MLSNKKITETLNFDIGDVAREATKATKLNPI